MPYLLAFIGAVSILPINLPTLPAPSCRKSERAPVLLDYDGVVPDDPKEPLPERIARAMAAVDGRPWEPMLPQARAACAGILAHEGIPAAADLAADRRLVEHEHYKRSSVGRQKPSRWVFYRPNISQQAAAAIGPANLNISK